MWALRVVVRVGILWVASLLVSFAGMALAHRFVVATEDRQETAPMTRETPSTVWVGDELVRRRASATRF